MFWSTAVQVCGAIFWELLLNLIHGSAPGLRMMAEKMNAAGRICHAP